MMARSVKEWIADHDNQAIPARVKVRIFELHGRRCGKCGNDAGARPEFDHIIALINGGEHRESNLWPLCSLCHKIKTKRDVAIKALTAKKIKSHYGFKRRKGRPMPGSKDSGWKRKMDGTWIKR